MQKKIKDLLKLRHLQKTLETTTNVFNELIKEKEELNNMLFITTGLVEGADILDSLQIVEYKIDDIVWMLNDSAKNLKVYMNDLGFNEELISEAATCKDLSVEIQYRLIREVANIFKLNGDTDLVRNHILSKNLKNVFFSDILNSILEVQYKSIS